VKSKKRKEKKKSGKTQIAIETHFCSLPPREIAAAAAAPDAAAAAAGVNSDHVFPFLEIMGWLRRLLFKRMRYGIGEKTHFTAAFLWMLQ